MNELHTISTCIGTVAKASRRDQSRNISVWTHASIALIGADGGVGRIA